MSEPAPQLKALWREVAAENPQQCSLDQLKQLQAKIPAVIDDLLCCLDKPVQVGDEVYDYKGSIRLLMELNAEITRQCKEAERGKAAGGPHLAPGCYGIRGAE